MIDTTKTIREVRYNGTAIPLLGGVDNPIVVTSDAEMETCLNDEKYLGMYVKFSGESENYLNGQVYKIAQEGEVSKFYQLPTLDNEGTAADLAAGKQLINSSGQIIVGAAESGNSELLKSICNKTVTELKASDLEGITAIPGELCANCENLTKIELSDTIETIGYEAFSGCNNLVEASLGNVRIISGYAFHGCTKLSNLNLGNSLEEIGGESLFGCALTSLTLPNSLRKIGYTSLGSNNFTEITIPINVTEIGYYPFQYCNNLVKVIMLPTSPPVAGHDLFEFCDSFTTLVVPRGSLSAYQTATNWSRYADKMVEASN